ncbi:hypothetical protein KL86DYS2_12111 [uncultured Dysgonomonas sp.]|uniref:Uncharacterized protein n=1 Tax=uncultured Dysgonomonas sp. TaxID=206096 RepID=A0A212JQN7_9BACT|nr:hypothetical protein KL86DYS2_12111 [uncultured Dysgonomonas sp.]
MILIGINMFHNTLSYAKYYQYLSFTKPINITKDEKNHFQFSINDISSFYLRRMQFGRQAFP